MKRSPLRRRSRLRPVSRARARRKREWESVYRVVDARSGGRCEVALGGTRCPRLATQHHHTLKPRASHHRPELVIHICASCHARVDAPYRNGKLRIYPWHGLFFCDVISAPDKFAARVRATVIQSLQPGGSGHYPMSGPCL